MSVYRVTAPTYREHTRGSLFEADLSPDTEARAVRFGAITLIERSTTTLQPGTYRLPDGWTETHPFRAHKPSLKRSK